MDNKTIRSLAAEYGFHDPTHAGELNILFDGAGRRRKYLRRSGISLDAFAEILWDRGLTPGRPDLHEVYALLESAFSARGKRTVRRAPGRTSSGAGRSSPCHRVCGMSASWRDRARPIIAKVLAETKGQDEKAIKAALFDAYPFGERRYHPYKIWLDEIRRQRGFKGGKAKLELENAGQEGLFR